MEEALRAAATEFQLLVQGVTDYAIYLLSPSGEISVGMPAPSASRGIQRTKYWAHTSRASTAADRAASEPRAHSALPPRKAVSAGKPAGAQVGTLLGMS